MGGGGHDGRVSEATGPDEAAEELYAGPPAEFVARRDALAAQARTRGDRAAAARIKALRRPTVGAWYLNTGARADLPSLGAVLELGGLLRRAQADGDVPALRDLARRRGPLVAEVVRDLTALMAGQGTVATPAALDEVRTTLAAALADPAVAVLVEQGRVDRPYAYGGFGDVPPAAAAPEPSGGTGDAPVDLDAARRAREEAERVRREAAEREWADASAASGAATARRAAAESTVGELRARIEGLETALTAARRELAAAEDDRADAAAQERAATARLDRARHALPS